MSFDSIYTEMFGDEPYEISKNLYGRRKWKVVRSMSKEQLLKDFKRKEIFKLNSFMSKAQILRQMKKYSWAF